MINRIRPKAEVDLEETNYDAEKAEPAEVADEVDADEDVDVDAIEVEAAMIRAQGFVDYYAAIENRVNTCITADTHCTKTFADFRGVRKYESGRFLTISHEKQANGKINSVVYIDSNAAIPSGVTGYEVYDTIRLQLKLSRNPLSGRSDTLTEPAVLRAALVDFVNDAALWTKFLNQES